jgi:hypothetical protein
MTYYKIVERSNRGNLRSIIADRHHRVYYKKGQWSKSSNPVMIFADLDLAYTFSRYCLPADARSKLEIWECEAKMPTQLNFVAKKNKDFTSFWRRWKSGENLLNRVSDIKSAPLGTLCAESAKLTRKII